MRQHTPLYSRIIRGLFRGIKRLLTVAIIVFLTTTFALQVPYFQTIIVQKLAKELSLALGFPVTIGHVDIRWFDTLELDDIIIKDQLHNPMIEAKRIEADFELSALIQRNIRLDHVLLRNGNVNIFTDTLTQKMNINEFIKSINRLIDDTSTKRSASPPIFAITDIELDNVKLAISDFTEDSITESFDYYHIRFDSLSADVHGFRVRSDTLDLQVNGLTGIETGSNIRIHYLNTFFRYTEKTMHLWNLDARLNNTFVSDTLEFFYDDTDYFKDFNEKIVMYARMDSSIISAADIALFAPELKPFNETVTLSGVFKGKVSDFNVRNCTASFGNNSYFQGGFSMKGLPDFDETFIAAKVKNAFIDPYDLRQYIDNEEAMRTINIFGTIDFKGSFNGFPSDFVAAGTFNSDLGKIETDIRLTLAEDSTLSTYEGNLHTEGLDIGLLTDNQNLLSLLDMKGHIKGRGFTLASASADVDATVSRIGLNHYDYRNIVINATLGKRLFNGHLEINDPNLIFNTNSTIDLRSANNIFDVKAQVLTANLQALHLSPKPAEFSTVANVHFTGVETDAIAGNALFVNTEISYNKQNLLLDSVSLQTDVVNRYRTFQLKSDWLKTQAKGHFNFEQLLNDVPALVSEYALILQNKQSEIDRFYAQRKKHQRKHRQHYPEYDIDFTMLLRNINPIIHLFDNQYYVAKNTRLEGSFSNGKNSTVLLSSHPDTLKLQNHLFYGSDIDFSASKVADSTDIVASAYVYSRKQHFEGLPASQNMFVDATWSDKHINFSSRIDQQKSTNYARLAGDIYFRKGQTEANLRPSVIHLLGKSWEIADNNAIVLLENQKVLVRNLQVSNDKQLIKTEGIIAKNTTDSLQVLVENFELFTLDTLLDLGLTGLINANVGVRNLWTDPTARGKVQIGALSVDDFLIGDVDGTALWDEVRQKLRINLDINRLQANVLKVIGHYDPRGGDNELDMNILVNGLSVKLIEPFIRDYLSEWGGLAEGTLKVHGRSSNPIIDGDLMVNKGSFKVNIINTVYTFTDKIHFGEGEISFHNVRILDESENIGQIHTGRIWHTGFKNWGIDLFGDLRNFQVMNLKSQRKALYYGTANVTGSMYMRGSFSNLSIGADVRSEKGTRIFIPVSSYYEEEESIEHDFIHFVGKTSALDTVQASDTIPKVSLSGLKLDFNFELTPEAYGELIFDQKAGDIVRANGEGKIKLGLDTRGDFTMFGQYNITKGSYNFTLKNLVNKAFTIQPNSYISWNGDPLGGQMNINASYNLNASLKPLTTDSSILLKPELQRKYPTAVNMRLEGGLLSPQIGLGLKIQDYPSVMSSYVTSFEAKIQSNEQELNRQVFSLLLLRSFMAEGTQGGVTIGAGGSISELLSNQLSSWVSEIDPNLQVEVDANGLDREALNAIRTRVSYNFMEGRLRVTRDGTFTNSQSQATATSVAGDWTLEYLLTRNGRFRIKAFHKNSQNVISTALNNNNNTSQGVSIMHTQSFDNLRDILPWRRRKKKNTPTQTPIILPKSTQTDSSTVTPTDTLAPVIIP